MKNEVELPDDPAELAMLCDRLRYFTPAAGEPVDLRSAKQVARLKGKEAEAADAQRRLFYRANGKRGALKTNALATAQGVSSSEVGSPLDAHRDEVIELFAGQYGIKEVHKKALLTWQLEVSYEQVRRYRIEHAKAIEERFKAGATDFSGLRLAHKKSRLEELHDLYLDRKQLYDQTQNREDYRLCLQTIEQIKRETDGDLVVRGKIDVAVEATIQLHIQQEVMRSVNIQQLVLSRVAAMQGVNPMWLMAKLQRSHYAKFNGFVNDNIYAEQNDEVVYPSERPYDFDAIKRQHEDPVEQKAELEAKTLSLPVPEPQASQVLSLKEALRQKLAGRKSGPIT